MGGSMGWSMGWSTGGSMGKSDVLWGPPQPHGSFGVGGEGFWGRSEDLSGHPIPGHARLRGTAVGAHLQPDDALPLLQFILREDAAVLL